MEGKIFCYNVEEAKRNRCYISGTRFILYTMLFVILCIPLIILPIIGWIVIAIFAIYIGFRLAASLSAYAIDEYGRIYWIFKNTYGTVKYYSAPVIGNAIDKSIKSNLNIGRSIGEVASMVMIGKTLNKFQEYIRNPENITQIIEDADRVSGATVFEILKTHSHIDKDKYVQFFVDIKNLKKGIIKQNKKIRVYKAYENYDELFNILINKKNS